MVFTQKPISPGESGTEDRPQKSVSNPGGVGLDFLRISDRCTAWGASASSGFAGKNAKNGNSGNHAQTTVERGNTPSAQFSPASYGSSYESRATAGDEPATLAALCPSPVHFKRSRVDSVTGEVKSTEITRKSCNKKSCVVCGPVMRKRLVGHFSRQFSGKSRLAFLTLTLDPKCGVPVADSRKYVVWLWSRFRKRLHRKGEFAFLAALESHKSGHTHMHVLCSLPDGATDEVIRSAWFAVGGGVVMDIQRIEEEPEKVVGYVVKYIFKDAAEAKGRRSMLCSAGISYHSAAHKKARREYARLLEVSVSMKGSGQGSGEGTGSVADLWEPLTHGVGKGSQDTPTRADIERFRPLSRSLQRTTLYTHETADGRRWITYYDVESRGIRSKELQGEMTRSAISKEIGRIRAQQSVP